MPHCFDIHRREKKTKIESSLRYSIIFQHIKQTRKDAAYKNKNLNIQEYSSDCQKESNRVSANQPTNEDIRRLAYALKKARKRGREHFFVHIRSVCISECECLGISMWSSVLCKSFNGHLCLCVVVADDDDGSGRWQRTEQLSRI